MNAVYRIGPGDEHRVYPYQTWDGYPSTPELTSDYPNQFVHDPIDMNPMLVISKGNYWGYGQWGHIYSTDDFRYYGWGGESWIYVGTGNPEDAITQSSGIPESNVNIYTDNTLTVFGLEATTTGSGQSKIRVRTMVRV